MKILKRYLESKGSVDEEYYLGCVMHELYKEYQHYHFYFDIDYQTSAEAVDSVLENQLKGRVSLEDVHWCINLSAGDDCITLYDFTNKRGTFHSFLHQTAELSDRCHNPDNPNFRKPKKRRVR